MRTRAIATTLLVLLTTLAAASLPPQTANAQAAVTVRGQVLDHAGQPVPQANVHAARSDRFSFTDANGRFTLTDVPSASPMVVAAKEGWAFATAKRENDRPLTVRLAQQTKPPRSEYPRPDADRRPFTKNAWQSLNGTWSFDLDPANVGEQQRWFDADRQLGKTIQVPFGYQSLAAFGEQELATDNSYRGFADGYVGTVWYRRQFTVPRSFAGQDTRLRIGATNWGAAVWLDGKQVLPYQNEGDVELTVDLGKLAAGSTHTLAVKVVAPAANLTTDYPIGRRDIFGNSGGIWQSVWIEPVDAITLENPQVIPEVTFDGTSRTPSSAAATVKVQAAGTQTGNVDVTIRDPEGKPVGRATTTLANGQGQVRIPIAKPKLWDLDTPNLYTADVTATAQGETDGVRVTFGLRKIERKPPRDGVDYQYVWLNNRPVYLRGALDQGFNPWGHHTPTGEVTGPDFTTGTAADPGRGSIAYDLESVKKRNLNLVRAHVKVFEPAYYHWADQLGLLVWHEKPNPGRGPTVTPTAQGFFEQLLKDVIVRDRNHPSIVIWGLYNEGWGASGGPFPLQPQAITFIKSMVDLSKREYPGVLVVDNSPCCENGHTSGTDLNDNHGWSEFSTFMGYLEGFSKDLHPGSQRNFDEGTQNGQPWLTSEFSFNSGAQLTYVGQMRGFEKHAGYVGVQLADQEHEMVSPYTYDRQDRGPLYLDHTGKQRGVELIHGDDTVSIMSGSIATVTPGQRLDLPVRVSHWSDLNLRNAKLRWKIAGYDRVTGKWSDPEVGGSRNLDPAKYAVTDAGMVSVTIPANLRVGYVWVWLEYGGETVAENLVLFDDGRPEQGAFDPMRPTAQQWSGGSRIPLYIGDNEQVAGLGRGYFEYEATIPEAARNGGTLIVEASSAEAPLWNDGLHASNARKFPTELTVSVDGKPVQTHVLPDDPWYTFAIAGRAHGAFKSSGDGDHYGYRIAVPLTAQQVAGKDSLTVRFASNGGGLQLYGLHSGAEGAPPRIVAERVTSDVPARKPTVTDRPGISFTPARLDQNRTGTAIVSVVNDTHRTVKNVVAKLDLPTGWEVTPVDSATIAQLKPTEFAHVAFTVQAPSSFPSGGTANATATAFWTDQGDRRVVQLPGEQTWRDRTEVQGPGASVSGDARSEAIYIAADGQLRTWHNVDGFSTPWGDTIANIASGVDDPGRIRLADLDGDGKTDLVRVESNGDVKAWRNERGYAENAFGGTPVTIDSGVTDPSRLKFADLDGDRKADLVHVGTDGKLQAWRNERGFADNPFGTAPVDLGTGHAEAVRVHFADLDADRKAELVVTGSDGLVRAWHNDDGFAADPWGANPVTIGAGWNDPNEVRMPDLDGDGKSEIVAIQPGGVVRVWRNGAGFADFPWVGDSIVIGTGFDEKPRLLFG